MGVGKVSLRDKEISRVLWLLNNRELTPAKKGSNLFTFTFMSLKKEVEIIVKKVEGVWEVI